MVTLLRDKTLTGFCDTFNSCLSVWKQGEEKGHADEVITVDAEFFTRLNLVRTIEKGVSSTLGIPFHCLLERFAPGPTFKVFWNLK